MLAPFLHRGFFITATGTDAGKTTVTAALAAALHRLNIRTGVLKPVASGCPKYPGKGNDRRVALTDADLIPVDSLLPAQALQLDVNDDVLMGHLSPVRYAAPISPHLAAELEGRPVDWKKIAAAAAYWHNNADVLLVEGAGGWLTPLERRGEGAFTIADLAADLQLPVILVTSAQLGSINTTLLTAESIRARNLAIAGVVINRLPPENARDLSEEKNLIEIPRLSGLPLLAILPQLSASPAHPLPEVLVAPMLALARTLLD